MTDANHSPRRKRFYAKAAAGLLVVAAFVATCWYVSSGHFKKIVQSRIVAYVEQATGGRTEIGEVSWKLWKLEFEAQNVTVHGREGLDEIPYLHADRVYLQAKIISAISRRVGLRVLELERPVLHLIIYPDGSTNQPVPRRKKPGRSPIEQIIDMAADKLEVRRGEMRINDRPIPIDFAANEVAAALTYDAAGPRYHGTLHIGKIDAKFKDMRPFSVIADAQFSLSGHTLNVTSLAMRSGQSELQAGGVVQDLASPTIDITYRATLDLGDVGAITRETQMKDGLLHLEGRGTYTEAAFITDGKLAASGVDWYDRNVKIRNAAGTSDYRVDNRRIVLSNLSGRLFGGRATGNLEIVNWRADEQQGSNAQRGTGRFEVNGVALGQLAAAVSSRTLPLDRMNFAGATSGTVVANWTGQPSNVIADMSLSVTAPGNAAPQQLPVTAIMNARYDGRAGVLNVRAATISTPATRIEAAGTLGSTRADLQVTASTSNLGELAPIITAQGQLERLPLEVHGRASFSGAVAGRFSQPSIAGQLHITDFESLLNPPAALQKVRNSQTTTPTNPIAPTASARRMHWDALTTTLQYSPSLLVLRNGVLRRGTAQINFDLNAHLIKGRFEDNSPFTAHVRVENAQVTDLQTLAGFNYPATGVVDLDARLSGTQQDPEGRGHIEIRNARVHGQPVARAVSDVGFAKQELQFNNISVTQNGARVLGAAAYNVSTRAYRFRLRGDNFKLASFAAVQTQRIKVGGLMSFDTDGSGTSEAPIINANVRIADMVVNGEEVGDLVAQARTVGEILTLTARSNVSKADLTLDGTVRLRDDYPAVLSARFVHLDIDPVLQAYLRGRLTGHSSFAGNVEARGPLRRVHDMSVEGELSQFYVPVENIQVRNQGPVRFGIARQVLDVRALHLLAEGTDFTATGQAQLAGEHQLNLSALGRANLKLVQTLNPDYVSYGNVAMDVKVNGTAANPIVNGRVQVANAGISYIDLPNGLSDINGTLVFNRDRLQIQQMTAHTGGGTLNLTGYVTYARTIGFNIQAVGKDIRLRYPPGVSAVADANVRLSGTLRNSLLSGDVTVTKFGLNPRFDFALYLARSKQTPALTDPNSPLNSVKLDLHVTSTPELQVQTSLARLSGNVDLRLRGTAARPNVIGRVDIIEGDVFFNGTKYHVERGDITFTNPTKVEPVLDIEASTRVRDYDITLGFHGPVDKLSTTYRSDPPLATADIIALLAFGRTREESAMQSVSSQNFTETASNAILGQALNATVSSRVQRLFGVSRIKIDPQVGGAENNPSGARVTIEQQVANDLTITYITDLARSNQQIISVEYNVTRKVSVVAVRDQNGIVSFDVRIRQRKR